MQLCSIQTGDSLLAAVHRDGFVYELRNALTALTQQPVRMDCLEGLAHLDVPAQIMAVAQSDELRAHIAGVLDHVTGMPESSVRYGVPVAGPIIGVGRNYQDHVSEGGLPTGEYPKLFFNHPNALTAHNEDILIPAIICKADWEAELGVVVGMRMCRVAPEEALNYVAGYLNVNDVSAREFQFDFGPAQTSFAKSMDGFCPCGPWFVTRDEIPNCQDLSVRCEVNGQVKQEGNTAYMINSVAHVLSHISQFMTLEPGTLIATGTPHGVGHFMNPPEYLDDGDEVRVSVSGLGVLQNRFVREQQ